LVRDEDLLLEFALTGHPFPSPEVWQSTRGAIHGTADATRAANAKTSIVAGGGSLSHCRIRLTWS
jgi:hypothetical protein